MMGILTKKDSYGGLRKVGAIMGETIRKCWRESGENVRGRRAVAQREKVKVMAGVPWGHKPCEFMS